ncbi:hypothetical protein VP01_12515g1 [Puccinia sorghi]|uniref:Uncharacterized protein n=1 Tax=Puccinia sorghi TaxID=27349 RepID=A0A0L6VQW8_9BASI|nr:hypothetical protein VP01_12515g1 [Puccinia sorghi]
MRRHQIYWNLVYKKFFHMTRTLQCGYQALDQSRLRNQGTMEMKDNVERKTDSLGN